ncbi:hypothetical protein DP49_5885 [Burkholderia pseudomallei]|nr:hypothetical protein DP49_5885 [Burkholderia pseudomallei]
MVSGLSDSSSQCLRFGSEDGSNNLFDSSPGAGTTPAKNGTQLE